MPNIFDKFDGFQVADDRSDLNDLLNQDPSTQYLGKQPSPTPTPTPQPSRVAELLDAIPQRALLAGDVTRASVQNAQGNAFDKFDQASNPFDRFDDKAQPTVAAPSQQASNAPETTKEMTPEEMSRTGQLQFEPNAATAGTEQYDPFTGKVASDVPMVSADTIQNALNSLGQVGGDTSIDPTTAAINKAIAERASGLTSEKFLSTLPIYAIPGVAELTGAQGLNEAVPEFIKGVQEGDPGKITGGTLDAAVNALMLGHRAIHGVSERMSEPKASEAAEQPPTQPQSTSPAPSASEAATAQPQERIQSQTAQPVEKPDISPSQAERINLDNLPDKGEPAPAAEDAAPEAQTVRQPLSLDELRLMREKADLQLQNEISKRATGRDHPAVNERIAQIDDELDQIANNAMGDKFEQLPSDVAEEVHRGEEARDDRAVEEANYEVDNGESGASVQDAFANAAAAESRPSDNAPRGQVGESAGLQQSAPQQPASVGSAGSAQAGAKTRPIGVAETYVRRDLGDQFADEIQGSGVTWQQARKYGQDYINKGGDPEAPIRKAKQGKTSWQDVGIVSAEYERRAVEKQQAYDALQKDPNNPQLARVLDNAEKAQADWRKQMQPVLTRAGDALRAAQGERAINPATYDGLSQIAMDKMGKKARALTPQERTALGRAVKEQAKGTSEALDAAEQVRQVVRKRSGGRSLSLDELVRRSEDFYKRVTADCVT